MSFESLNQTDNLSVFSAEKENIEEYLQDIVNNTTRGLDLVDIETSEFDKIEDLFKESATLEDTLKNINVMVKKLVDKIEMKEGGSLFKASIDNRSTKSKTNKVEMSNPHYENLEKMLQKYEKEIREHIRVEQQLKIYSETLEEKIDNLKLKVQGNKKKDESVKGIAKLQKENERLKNEVKMLERKLFKYKKKQKSKSVCIDHFKHKSSGQVN